MPPWRRLTCNFCGKAFAGQYNITKLQCSPTCAQKAWRAYTMLAGTHGYVGHQWKRLDGRQG